jgi:hypothetical protein
MSDKKMMSELVLHTAKIFKVDFLHLVEMLSDWQFWLRKLSSGIACSLFITTGFVLFLF